MATTKLDIDIGIEVTVVALREKIMGYFKGTCVESFVDSSYITMFDTSQATRGYYADRREALNQRKTIVLLSGVPLFTLQHYPEKVTFHTLVLRRSPELSQVEKELKKFFKEYLAGVEIEDNKRGVNYA